MRRLAAGMIVLGAAAPAALADGGSSVAGAPVVPYGAPQAGTHAAGLKVAAADSPTQCPEYHSLWAIDARKGDEVGIDWQSPGPDVRMQILPLATTDAAIATTPNLVISTLNENRMAHVRFRATTSGRYPLDFFTFDCPGVSDDPTTYEYTATVKHGARLSLPKLGSIDRSGSVAVKLRAPDGRKLLPGSKLTVRLQLTSAKGGFHTIGRTTASGGSASIDFNVPPGLRGRRGRLRAVATGTDYVRSVSAERVVAT